MYITSANLSDLLDWFQASRQFQFLLLFAAGDQNSAAFIGSLFDQKETIDVVSSVEVAVLLFAPEDKSAIAIGKGKISYLQGKVLVQSPNQYNSRIQLPIETISINDIRDATYRDQIVQASIVATHQLTEELGLGPNDVPAWILFSRDSCDPLILRTKGQDDFCHLIDFLKSLRQIQFKHLKAPRVAATSRRHRLKQSYYHLQDARQQLEIALSQWRQYAIVGTASNLLPSTVTPENAIEILKWPRPSDSIVKDIVRQWHRYKSAEDSITRLEIEIQEITDSIKSAPKVLECNEQEVSRLINKFELLFGLKLIGTKLSSFVRIITGAGKHAQEVTDVVSKLRKALGNDV